LEQESFAKKMREKFVFVYFVKHLWKEAFVLKTLWRFFMKNKKFFFGILIIVLVFGIFLTGCGEIENSGGGYTFEFKVESDRDNTITITKVEFINGSSSDGQVLKTVTVQIGPGEWSDLYIVSGFTKKEKEENERIFGVKVTYDGGDSQFIWATENDKVKVRVYCVSDIGLFLHREYYW
jgi:hypothetical protein